MTKIRFGIIGLGGMGRLHLINLLGLHDVEVVAVSDVDDEKLRLAKEYGIEKTFKDYRELLSSSVDAVIIATPPFLHREQAVAALEQGKHVFLEKPMGVDLEDARAIYDAVKKSGSLFMIGYCLRFHDVYIWIKGLENKLGSPLLINHIALGKVPHHNWLVQKEKSGGMLNENGVHVLYLFYWYAGRFKRVSGFYKTFQKGLSIEDNIVFEAEHKRGGLSSLVQSWSSDRNYRLWSIVFEKGALVFEGYLGGTVQVTYRVEGTPKTETKTFDMDWAVMYEKEIEHFVQSIRKNEKTVINEEDGLEIQKAVDAAYRSLLEGRIIEV